MNERLQDYIKKSGRLATSIKKIESEFQLARLALDSSKSIDELKTTIHTSYALEVNRLISSLINQVRQQGEEKDINFNFTDPTEMDFFDNRQLKNALHRILTEKINQYHHPLFKDVYKIIKSSDDTLMYNMRMHAQRQFENRLRFDDQHTPKALALSGGGGRGVLYSAVLKTLESVCYDKPGSDDYQQPHGNNALSRIQHVAGTSAGAMTAIPLAFGYSADEIDHIIRNKKMTDLFSKSALAQNHFSNFYSTSKNFLSLHNINGPINSMLSAVAGTVGWTVSKFKLNSSLKNLKAHQEFIEYHSGEGMMEMLSNFYYLYTQSMDCVDINYFRDMKASELRRFIMDTIDDEVLIQMQKLGKIKAPATSSLQDIRHALLDMIRSELRNEDLIEAYLGDVIHDGLIKTLGDEYITASKRLFPNEPDQDSRDDKMRNISAFQFACLRRMYPDLPFKRITLSITEIQPDREESPFINHMVNEYNREFRHTPLALIARTSMNMPLVFEDMIDERLGAHRRFTDGFITANTPSSAFKNTPMSQIINIIFMPDQQLQDHISVRNIFTPESEKVLSTSTASDNWLIRQLKRFYAEVEFRFRDPLMGTIEQMNVMRNHEFSPFLQGFRHNTLYLKTDISPLDIDFVRHDHERFQEQYEQVIESTRHFIQGDTFFDLDLGYDIESRFVNHKLDYLMTDELRNDRFNGSIIVHENQKGLFLPSIRQDVLNDLIGENEILRRTGYDQIEPDLV